MNFFHTYVDNYNFSTWNLEIRRLVIKQLIVLLHGEIQNLNIEQDHIVVDPVTRKKGLNSNFQQTLGEMAHGALDGYVCGV